jgi:predicted nucleic acid-binding protein
MKRIILDTNIILRIIDRTGPDHNLSYNLVKRLISEDCELCIIPQVLIELWVVATRPVNTNGFGWDAAYTMMELEKLQNIFVMLPDNESIFTHWKNIVSQGVYGKRAHDARIAAAAFAHNADAIATLNIQDFQNFGIQIISP